jgi:Protein of unknown function DUF262
MTGNGITDVTQLREFYRDSSVARAFLDLAASRERDQAETKVERAMVLMKAAGHDYPRQAVVDMFRRLAACECGDFVVGRRGWPSRFIWSKGLRSVGRAAAGSDSPIAQISPDDEESPAHSVAPGLERIETEPDEADGEDLGEVEGTGLEREEEPAGDAIEIIEPFDPAKIRVDTKPMVISLLLDRIKNKEIDLTPDFQRKGGIWTNKAKSQLIESLLIRIPLPAFYMDGGDESRWLVVDGLQRLSTLKEFVLDRTLKLSGLEFLGAQCNGSTFDRLPRNLQRRIFETQVTVFVIQENTPPEVKFNIFKRINTGGLPLSSQEIRHALNQGRAPRMLKELAESAEFKTATNDGIRDDRMGDRECVLRVLGFLRTSFPDYRAASIDAFLNQCMADLNKISEEEAEELSRRFRRSMVDCFRISGDRAFRKQVRGTNRRFPINRALIEVWAANIEALEAEQVDLLETRRQALQERFIGLLEDEAFQAAISYGTGDPQKVRLRFSRVNEIIQETLA